jgi:arylesterase/paraoxonase
LGISLYQKAGSANRLFAVNSRSSAHRTVEIFEVADERIVHLRTVEDEQHLISPNDLVAVGHDQFYVTNDHAFSNVLLQYIENNVFRYTPSFHSGSVSYFDGEKFTTVAHRLSYPNGIVVARKTPDRMYIASLLGKELLVAEWNKSDPSRELSFTGSIPLPCFPDNLEWDADGNLWVGANSDFEALTGYAIGLRTTSPSRVLRISSLEGPKPTVEEIWTDNGTQLSSSSVAGIYKRADGRNLVVIGAAFDDHMLLGQLQTTDD